MKKTIFAVLAAVAAVGAQAATVSFQYGLPVVESTTEINQTGTLGLFDSSLGTLTGATIEVFGSATMLFGGTNTAAQAQRATLTSSVELFWTSSLGALTPFLADSLLMTSTSGSQSYAVGETKSFGPFPTVSGATDNLATILASLQAAGGGSFTTTCESSSGLAVQGGGGNISTTQNTTAGCGAKITYEYTATPPVQPVPEPASLALVGLALAGVAAASRRKA